MLSRPYSKIAVLSFGDGGWEEIWAEVGQSWDNAARAIGDALMPVTNLAGHVAGSIGDAVTMVSTVAPNASAALLGVGTALVVLKGIAAAWAMGKGAANLAKGGLLARAGAAALPGAAGVAEGAAGAVAASKLGKLAKIGEMVKGAGRAVPGMLGRVGGGLAGAGRLGLAAASSSAGMVAGAGMAGWGIGSAAGAAFEKVMGASLGTKIYDWSHASGKKATDTTLAAKKPPVQNITNHAQFSPNLSITVKGDVKDPAQLAREIMPHLKGLFGQWQSQQQRAALHDAAHV